jgi:uncharacterized protein (TIGR00369 family)
MPYSKGVNKVLQNLDQHPNNNEIIQKICDELKKFNVDELKQVKNTIHSLEETRESVLPYLARFMGIQILGNDQFSMELGLNNANNYGIAQGGAVYTLADIAIGFFIDFKLEEKKRVLTLEMKINYIKPGKGKRLIASPKIIYWRNKIAVCECAIEDDHGDLVAQTLGTFYITD